MKGLFLTEDNEISLEDYYENIEGVHSWLEKNVGKEEYYWYHTTRFDYHFKYKKDGLAFEKMMKYLNWLYIMDLLETYNIILGSPYESE